MDNWISVEDRLPKIGQLVQFVNDISRNDQSKFYNEIRKNPLPVVTVRAGYVYEVGNNYIQTGPISEYHTAVGYNGLGDHISHWQPLAPPPETK